ncbi:MAG: hypothetical protein P8X89_21455 [Reinekea sp.]
MTTSKVPYYVMKTRNSNRMLCGSLATPHRTESWTLGRPFKTQPKDPVVARIREGDENGELLPYFDNPQLISDALYETLLEVGVNNMDVYEAVIRSVDGTIEHRGYKAMNLLGLVSAADMSKTEFFEHNPSRLIDASIKKLVIDEAATQGFLMFRLAESTEIVLVHEMVKQAIEAKGFHSIVFDDPGSIVTL